MPTETTLPPERIWLRGSGLGTQLYFREPRPDHDDIEYARVQPTPASGSPARITAIEPDFDDPPAPPKVVFHLSDGSAVKYVREDMATSDGSTTPASEEQGAPERVWLSKLIALSENRADWHAHVTTTQFDADDVEYVHADRHAKVEAALGEQLAQAYADNERLARVVQDIEEREAAVCPEGVGFDEYVRTLQRKLEARPQAGYPWTGNEP